MPSVKNQRVELQKADFPLAPIHQSLPQAPLPRSFAPLRAHLANISSMSEVPLGKMHQGTISDEREKSPLASSTVLDSNTMLQQYEVVGRTLIISEAASIKVGIPWLPPTPRATSLAEQFEGPLDEFIRDRLVAVHTNTLEAYCDDLEMFSVDQENNQNLFLYAPSVVERFGLCAAMSATIFIVSLFCAGYFVSSALLSFTVAVLFSVSAAFVGITVSSEAYRRASFYCVISNEISRRRGVDPNSKSGGRPLHVYPTGLINN